MGKRSAVRLGGHFKRLFEVALDLFFERMECPICRGESPGLCKVCRRAMEEWGPFTHDGVKGQAMFHYSGAAATLIYAYKKRLSLEALRAISLMIDSWLEEHELGDLDCIVPVTSIRSNVRKRGFDPGLQLADVLAKKTGIPLVNCLKNQGRTENKARNFHDRKEMAGESFIVKLPEGMTLQGKRVLIFDDIMTTGATMEAAGRLIKAQGAAHTEFIVFARATA